MGSQKWQGAAPSFISIDIVSIARAWFEKGIRIELKSKMIDARAWVRKYLIAASFSWLVED